MFAACAGASEVHACEMLGVMCDIARDVVNDNRLSDRVKVVNKNSTDICISDDLPCR